MATRSIRVGILCEGNTDDPILKPISEKIVNCIDDQLNVEHVIDYFNGPATKDKIAIKLPFFFEASKADILLLHSDVDGKKGHTSKINMYIESINYKKWPVVAILPDPSLEQWLFDEEVSLKNVFRLEGSMPIPYNDLHPKPRLKKIFEESAVFDFTILEKHVRGLISEKFNINLMKNKNKSDSFHKFYEKFTKIVSQISQRRL